MHSGKYLIQIYNWARWKLRFRFNFQLPAFFKSFRKLFPFVWNSKEDYIHVSSEHLGAAIFLPHSKWEVKRSRCEVHFHRVSYLIQNSQAVTVSPCGASHVSGAHRPRAPGGSCTGQHGVKNLLMRWQEREAVSVLSTVALTVYVTLPLKVWKLTSDCISIPQSVYFALF